MSDTIGRITVPALSVSGTAFPIQIDYPHVTVSAPKVYVHQMESTSADQKIEQRFLAGAGARSFQINRGGLTKAQYATLAAFYEGLNGPYQPFVFPLPSSDGASTTNVTVAFAAELNIQLQANRYLLQATLVEIVNTNPTYAVSATVARFPDTALQAALAAQEQQFIPLVHIRVREGAVPDIYLSDRRCIIDTQQYLPRLLDGWSVTQSLNGESDDANFIFGNADRVMLALANDTNLAYASIDFSLYHVGTGILLQFWSGQIPQAGWQSDGDSTFSIKGQDELADLTLQCPDRDISRTCWKKFDDGQGCPWTSVSGTGDGTGCDKGFATPNGCQSHGMDHYFGGIFIQPQAVRTSDNSTGFLGFGRTTLTSASIVADSVYSETVPHVYTDVDLSINAKIVDGRDEGDFYDVLGIVCEGPIGSYGAGYVGTQNRIDPLSTSGAPLITFLLDGQLWHGYPGPLGLRLSLGNDPNPDQFSLGEGKPTTYGPWFAAGTAFVEIRRQDPSGLQLSKLSDHAMQVVVSSGMTGRVWTAPGTASVVTLTNPVWIVANEYFRCTGRRYLSTADLEALLDLDSIIGDGSTTGAATICNLSVPSLIGGGSEAQFKFVGTLVDRKPLRDWMREILNNCLGYFSRNFGKLRFGIRENASALTDFSTGNIVLGSLRLAPITMQFNRLTVNFANKDFGYLNDQVQIYDEDNAGFIGNGVRRYIDGQINLSGPYTKSQVIRIAATRLKEETGGATLAEQMAARLATLKSTVLGLDTEPGAVYSITHSDLVGGVGKFRCQSLTLHSDYSLDVAGRWVTEKMYDLDFGPKPADVPTAALPTLSDFHPTDWGFKASADDGGNVVIDSLFCSTYGNLVNQGIFDIWYADETGRLALTPAFLAGSYSPTTAVLDYHGANIVVPGDYLMIRGEIMLVTAVVVTSSPQLSVNRGQLGTTAAAFGTQAFTASSLDANDPTVVIGTAGLTWRAGDSAGIPFIARIASYDPATGRLGMLNPSDAASVVSAGTIALFDRVWQLSRSTVAYTFAPGFFTSHGVVDKKISQPLSHALLAAVSGYLVSASRIQSDVVNVLFPNRDRTHGGAIVKMPLSLAGNGTFTDVFLPAVIPSLSTFGNVQALILNAGNTSPIRTPTRSVFPIPDQFSAGSITLTGTVVAGSGAIEVTVGTIVVPAWFVPTDGSITTLAQCADALRDWLNGGDQFNSAYSADSSGAVISIQDIAGIGGAISALTDGTITATCAGLSPALNITVGRRYACTFRDSVAPYETSLSPVSKSSGPSHSAANINVANLPQTQDSRVDKLRIYATPDGLLEPFNRIAEIAIGSANSYADATTETTLAGLPAYGGPVQPASGGMTIVLYLDGALWLQAYIASGLTISTPVSGLSLGPIPEGSRITADIINADGAVDIEVLIA